MGAIKVAVPKSGVSTTVKDLRIVSAAFVSCEKRTHKIAIELANSIESDTRGGLRPANLPRLVCNQVAAPGKSAMTTSEVPTRWQTGELGDTLARGLSPGTLRRCVSIDVLQDVAMPAGAPVRSQAIALELTPYGRELDEVFVACGERTAYSAPVPERPVIAATKAAPVLSAPPAPPAKAKPIPPIVDSAWKPARTVDGGRTNVRAAPGIDARVVAQLPANARVLVQPATAPWWRVKPTMGGEFTGFVREDRLAFD
jgi:hypothetical protein